VTCRLCANQDGNRTVVAREMMLGLRDEFEYLECAAYGCVQIIDVPPDPGRYYPDDYYSYQVGKKKISLRHALRRRSSLHVLGHMHDPAAAVRQMADLLTDDGRVLLRTPLAESYAWRTYGTDWVQLDAPRHLHLFTVKNIEAMASAAGLRVVRTVYDSGSFQFWASEQIRMGIPLHAAESHLRDGKPFTKTQLRAFRRRAAALNRQADGDQAAFLLARAGDAGRNRTP
jgi:hypothetical protein